MEKKLTRPKLPVKQRREKIKKIISKVGFYASSQQALADKFGVSQQMVSKDIKAIIQELEPGDVKEIGVHLWTSLKNALGKCDQAMLTSNDVMVQLKAAKTVAYLADKLTTVLERYGWKERLSEHVVLDSGVSVENYEKLKKSLFRVCSDDQIKEILGDLKDD